MIRHSWWLMLLVVVCLVGCGSSDEVGPNDPKLAPGESEKMRQDAYTPEQREQRAQRPR